MSAKVILKPYFICPNCNEHEFSFGHLEPVDRVFTWNCDNCYHEISFCVNPGNKIEIIEINKPKSSQIYSLLKLKNNDIWLITKNYADENHDIKHWDYFFHSHQCPMNFLRHAKEIFTNYDTDPHGIFRYVNHIPINPETEKIIENANSPKDLFELFKTDGIPKASEWEYPTIFENFALNK